MNRVWMNNLGSRQQARLKMQQKVMEHAAKAAAQPQKERLEPTTEPLSLRQAQPTEAKSATVVKKEKKPKQAVESKVRVEQMMGFHHIWLVKARSG
jgi:hypothetical protein